MHITTLPIISAITLAAAQPPATAPPPASQPSETTALPLPPTPVASLINELPRCVLPCLTQAISAVSCSSADIACMCSSSAAVVPRLASCIVLGTCVGDEISKAVSLAPAICTAVSQGASPPDMAAASAIVASALSTGTTKTAKKNTISVNHAVGGEVTGALGAAVIFAAMAV